MNAALRIPSGSPVEDASRALRRVRDITADGTRTVVSQADLPHLIEAGRDTLEAGRDSALTAVANSVDRITGRRRRRRPATWLTLLGIGLLAVLGFGAWRFLRSSASVDAVGKVDDLEDDGPETAFERVLDHDSVTRATGEGMGTARASDPSASTASRPDSGPTDAADSAGALRGGWYASATNPPDQLIEPDIEK